MNAVFIGGSRRLGRMNAELARRLDNIIQKELRVLVGDANGFDRAAQKYLADHGYRSVVVYCTNGQCRNNVGDWPRQVVEFHGRGHGLEFYTAKDDAMLRDAEYGLFAWDGKSKGTLRNIRKMAELGKPSAVYVSPIKKFVTVRTANDAAALSRNTEAQIIGSEDLFADAA
jgi:nitrogen regulatory protein PII